MASIADAATATNDQKSFGFNPGSGGAGDTYDANGNLKTDTYKGITNITYNYLNLPSAIEWGTTKKIEFTYDAQGTLLTQKVYTGVTLDYQQDERSAVTLVTRCPMDT